MPEQPDLERLADELRTAITRLIKKLRSEAPARDKLSLTERAVIKQLAQRQPLLPSELAAMEKVTTQSMSQILGHLTELGYVVRQPSATDRRKVLVRLTEAGEAFIPQVRQEVNQWLHHALQTTCSADELTQLAAVIPLLEKLVAVA